MGTLGKAWPASAAPSSPAPPPPSNTCCNKGRSYIFTTAAPAGHRLRALKKPAHHRAGDALRANLLARIAQLRDASSGWLPCCPSATAIQPYIVGDNEALSPCRKPVGTRPWVPAIRPPTVPRGTARLRISVSAAHTAGDIDHLLSALKELA